MAYPKNTLDAIKVLEKANLISRQKEGKQKQNIMLTESGKMLGEIILSTEKYFESYFNFMAALNKKIFCIPDGMITFLFADPQTFSGDTPGLEDEIENTKLLLIDNGWKKNELIRYNQCRTTLVDFKNLCDKNLLYLILYRYSELRKSQNLESNQILKIVIKGMILDSIEEKIDFMMDNSQREIFGYMTVKLEKARPESIFRISSSDSIFQFYDELQDIFLDGLIPPILKREVGDMILAYLNLLNPFIGNLDFKVQEIVDEINKIKDDKKIIEGKEIKIKTLELFLLVYKKHCQMRNYDLELFR